MLRLPLELRSIIWREVLGNRLIHLEYYLKDSLDSATIDVLCASRNWSGEFDFDYGRAWGHLVCGDDGPENRRDKKRTWPDGYVQDVRIHELCSPPYQNQAPTLLEYCGDRKELMHLTLLRSCRQIYVEANSILWTTNTYSFKNAITFKHFMRTRSIHQKRTIRKVRFDFPLDPAGVGASWDSALNTALIRSMSGLRCLRIHLDFIMEASHYRYAKDNHLLPDFYGAGLKLLSFLPLTEVEVYVRDPHQHWNSTWTKEDREEFADGLRGMLLDPLGADIYAGEQQEEKERRRKLREQMAEIKASRRPARTQNIP